MINARRRQQLGSKLKKVSMKARYKAILAFRFGIEDGIYHSLPETGREFGMTFQGVHRIEQKFYKLIGEKK